MPDMPFANLFSALYSINESKLNDKMINSWHAVLDTNRGRVELFAPWVIFHAFLSC